MENLVLIDQNGYINEKKKILFQYISSYKEHALWKVCKSF